MQTTSVKKPTNSAFFRQIVIPDEHRDSIPFPREWFGQRVQVLMFPEPPLEMEDLNAETLAAIEEVQEMKRNPHLYKSYTDVDEMFKEILEGDDDDEV